MDQRLESLKKKDLINLLSSNRALMLEKQLEKNNEFSNQENQIADLTVQLAELKTRLDFAENQLQQKVQLHQTVQHYQTDQPFIQSMDPIPKKDQERKDIVLKQNNIFIKIGASAQFLCETSMILLYTLFPL